MSSKAAAKKTTIRRRTPGSMADQIDQLEVGQSIAVASRIPLGNGKKITSDAILEEAKKLRSGLSAYVGRVTEELDAREFKVESGSFVTDDKTGIHLTAVCTRMA